MFDRRKIINWLLSLLFHLPAVNSINVIRAHFSYERLFSSYVLALAKKFVKKALKKLWWNWHLGSILPNVIRQNLHAKKFGKNVGKIDPWRPTLLTSDKLKKYWSPNLKFMLIANFQAGFLSEKHEILKCKIHQKWLLK